MYDSYVDVVEYANWKDGGCDLHPACLECPLPKCIEEEPRGRQKRRLGFRAEAMKKMRSQGKNAREIAAAFKVSERTVQRAFCPGNGNGQHGQNSKLQKPNFKQILNSKS
jgi:Homeodomain-like domain